MRFEPGDRVIFRPLTDLEGMPGAQGRPYDGVVVAVHRSTAAVVLDLGDSFVQVEAHVDELTLEATQ